MTANINSVSSSFIIFSYRSKKTLYETALTVSFFPPRILNFIIENNIMISPSTYSFKRIYFTYDDVDDILYEDEVKLYSLPYKSNGYTWTETTVNYLDDDVYMHYSEPELFTFSTYDKDKSSLLKLKMMLPNLGV